MRLKAGLLSLAVMLLCGSVNAASLLYVVEGELTGSLDGNSFAGAPFTLSFTGDTALLQTVGSNIDFIDPVSFPIY